MTIRSSQRFWRETRASITPLSREGLDPASAERRLKEYFGVATLDAFGSFGRAEITAAGSALFYIEKTQIDSRPVAQSAGPRQLRRGACDRRGDPRQSGTHPHAFAANARAACSPPSTAR